MKWCVYTSSNIFIVLSDVSTLIMMNGVACFEQQQSTTLASFSACTQAQSSDFGLIINLCSGEYMFADI